MNAKIHTAKLPETALILMEELILVVTDQRQVPDQREFQDVLSTLEMMHAKFVDLDLY